ncbi:unnamed protein product [Coregonus sp. 'balchen']|nr:unnamed protein product [Coregonus sp. 'balchen']
MVHHHDGRILPPGIHVDRGVDGVSIEAALDQMHSLWQEKKLSWESTSLPFNGVPFQVVGTKIYECHQCKDRKTKAKEKYAAEMNKARWVHVFRDEGMKVAIHMNNRVEQQNEALKCDRPRGMAEHVTNQIEKASTIRAEDFTEVLRKQCAGYLKEITDLTYHLQVEEFMTDLSSHLQSLQQKMKAHVPQDKGLTLAFSPRKRKAGRPWTPYQP